MHHLKWWKRKFVVIVVVVCAHAPHSFACGWMCAVLMCCHLEIRSTRLCSKQQKMHSNRHTDIDDWWGCKYMHFNGTNKYIIIHMRLYCIHMIIKSLFENYPCHAIVYHYSNCFDQFWNARRSPWRIRVSRHWKMPQRS